MPDATESAVTNAEVANAMRLFGGSFARSLALAWELADNQNRAKIQEAWPELWNEYRDLATLKRRT